MLYLISGTSRSGKTLLTREISEQVNISYLSTDWLMMGFNDGIPEYGIHHLLWPNEIAKKMWPFLTGMLENMLWDDVDYIIEGEAMLPELLAPFIKKHPKKLRVCFLGYAEIDLDTKLNQVKTHSTQKNDWLLKESDDYIRDHLKNMIGYSKMVRNECKKHKVEYFDTSNDFVGAVQKAREYLLSSN